MKLKHILSESILAERVSSIVYHATSFPSAVKILGSDILGKGKRDNEFVSFTRSIQGNYHRGNKIIGIIFEFDGDMLNQKYRGKPVGTEIYYGDDRYDDAEDSGKLSIDDSGDEVAYGNSKENGQLEDRLYVGKTRGIQNVSRYIKSAIVYVPKEYMDDALGDEFEDEDYKTQLKSAKQAVGLLKRRDIPYTVVKSEKGLSKFRPRGNR